MVQQSKTAMQNYRMIKRSKTFFMCLLLSILLIILVSIGPWSCNESYNIVKRKWIESYQNYVPPVESRITPEERDKRRGIILDIIRKPQNASDPCEVTNFIPLVDSYITPKGRNNIFFIESSQPCNKILKLSPRQLCSIESAAQMNPDSNVFLYIVDSNGYLPTLENFQIWSVLNDFKNIHIKLINAKEFTKDSAIGKLFEKGLNDPQDYHKYHVSDLLRYTLLWKYAGTYLDLDIISQKPISSLGTNFAVEQEHYDASFVAAAGAINFDSDFIGRIITNLIMTDLAENFDGSKWDDSSVRVLTRALEKICGSTREIIKEQCEGFNLYPIETFYAIMYDQIDVFFELDRIELGMEKIKDSVGVHTWGKLTNDWKSRKTSNSVITQVGKQFCPMTFALDGDVF